MKRLPNRAHCGLLFLFFLLPYAYFIPPVSANVYSRMALVLSLVEERTLRIDRYERSMDKAYYRGHYYSDKPPLPALAGAPLYALFRPVLGETTYLYHHARLVALLLVSLPSALMLLSFFQFGLSRGLSPKAALALSSLYGFATLAFPFSSLFYGHQMAAVFLWFAYLLRLRPLVSGLFASCAVACDFLAGVGWLVLLAAALVHHRLGFWPYLFGSLFGFSVILGYNWACFDHPLRFGYHLEAEPVFREGMAAGFFGIGVPSLAGIKEILFSPRGLVVSSPHLLLAPLALFAAIRSGHLRDLLPPLLIFLLFLLANSGYYLPFAGSMIGPRLMVASLPFLSLLFFFAGRRLQTAALCIGLYSVFVMSLITAVNPEIPDKSDVIPDPFFQYILPRFLMGDLSENLASVTLGLKGFPSLLPLLLAQTAILCLLCPAWKNKPSQKP